MYLRHENIPLPYIDTNTTIPDLATNVASINNGLRDTIENVQDISHFIEGYVYDAIRNHEKQMIEKIASKTYDTISEIIEFNIRKEEFIKLLLCDETSEING